MSLATKAKLVARLDGFLYGVGYFSGNFHSYENAAYSVEVEGENPSITAFINELYRGQHEFVFDSGEKELSGTRELEGIIGDYLIRDNVCVRDNPIPDLQRTLTFQFMEMVHAVFEEDYKKLKVFELKDSSSNPPQQYSFFCILSRDLLLVTQFNSYSTVTP